MNRLLTMIAMVVLTIGVCLPSNAQTASNSTQSDVTQNYQVLKGKIGPYDVTMFLQLPYSNKENPVGYYYYNKYPENRFTLKLVNMVAINAKGSMNVTLHEYTKKGNHSGTFEGQYECRGDYYAGTFTNSKGKRFKFKLE